MATIERKPLPPPNSSVTAITEADRAEIIARANDVIDHYLNGPGSYFDAGTRKPLVGELGDNTVTDLKNFKDYVITSMQFADDPSSVMRSVVVLIDQAIQQVKKAAQNSESGDSIARPLPDTNDPIGVPRIVSPRALSNAALPISLPLEGEQPPPQAGSTPVRFLGRRIVNQPPTSMYDTRVPAAPLVPSDDPNYSGGLLGRVAALAGVDPQIPNQAAPPLDDEQEQAAMWALDARLSGSGNIRDAVALYKARKSKR